MKYLFPTSVSQALDMLEEHKGKARVIAGGTDLMVEHQGGYNLTDVLVDITRIPELNKIEVQGDTLVIGSTTPLSVIANSPLVKEFAPALAKGSSSVGCLQISNMGTLGGNLITAQPAADAAMAVGPLNSTSIVESLSGKKTMSLEELYAGFAKSHIDSSKDILTEIHIPCQKEQECSEFMRLELRPALALPMLNAAAMASVKDGKFQWVRITMGPVGVGPTRATVAEEWFQGKDVTKANIEEGSLLVNENASPRSNPLRGSKEYRLDTLPVIVKRGLTSIANNLGVEL